jgi:acylphosphatase
VDDVRSRIRVTGLVQGVWFRASAERQAVRLGLRGFARNEPDGSVIVEAEGPPSAVAAMVAWCRVGPPRADVASVEVTELAPTGGRGFTTR